MGAVQVEGHVYDDGQDGIELVGAVGSDGKIYPLKLDQATGRLLVDLGSGSLTITGEVEVKNDTGNPLPVTDDMGSFEAQHATLVGSTDTTFTFAQEVRMVRVTNWHTSARVLVKDGAIANDSDASAARIGKAPASDLPNSDWFPFKTTTIHLRSALAAEVTVEGYW